MEIKDKTIAMLIDAENISHNSLKAVFDEVLQYGRITIRRIYGDWTQQIMKGWSQKLAEYSFRPVQKFADIKGKNSTDIALIIDAMDILHDKKVDCFCLVSSDSDFTGLARRIREDRLQVVGVGSEKSANSLVRSCDIFRTVENLNKISKHKNRNKNQGQQKKVKTETKELIHKGFKMIEENDSVLLNELSLQIQRLDSSFDPRNDGFKNYLDMFDHLKSDYKYQYESQTTKRGAVWIKKLNK